MKPSAEILQSSPAHPRPHRLQHRRCKRPFGRPLPLRTSINKLCHRPSHRLCQPLCQRRHPRRRIHVLQLNLIIAACGPFKPHSEMVLSVSLVGRRLLVSSAACVLFCGSFFVYGSIDILKTHGFISLHATHEVVKDLPTDSKQDTELSRCKLDAGCDPQGRSLPVVLVQEIGSK